LSAIHLISLDAAKKGGNTIDDVAIIEMLDTTVLSNASTEMMAGAGSSCPSDVTGNGRLMKTNLSAAAVTTLIVIDAEDMCM
jgi:hypothetical protein